MTSRTRTRTTPRKPAMDPRLVAFCEAYLRTFNAAAAYRETHPGCAANTSWTNGQKALRKTEVQAYISKRLKQMVMSADEVLARLSDHANGSLEPFLDIRPGWSTVDLTRAEAKEKLRLLKKVRVTRQGIEIEIHDPQKALELMGKHHKLFTDKSEGTLTLTVEGLEQVLNKVYGSNDQS